MARLDCDDGHDDIISAPCDTMQSPDDQSGHELPQSLTVVYEVSGNSSFLEMALDAAYVGWAPWIFHYDYI